MVTDFKLSSSFAQAIAFAERSVEATEKTGDTNAMYIAVRNRDRKKMAIYFRKSTLDHGLSTADTTPIQRQILCNIQNDKKMCANTNIYSI